MFVDVFEALCAEYGVAPSKVLEEIGMYRSSYSLWKKGGEPSNATKKKIADYFGITVKELMSGEIKPPGKKPSVSDDDIKFALFGGDADEITDEQFEEVKRFAQFIKERNRERKKET